MNFIYISGIGATIIFYMMLIWPLIMTSDPEYYVMTGINHLSKHLDDNKKNNNNNKK